MNPNPPYPYYNPPFPPPPPNPNPNFSYPQQSPPNPSSIVNSSNPTLLTTLSNLNHFISLAETTLSSLSTLLPLSNFISCPYDPLHRMPPESLFRHSLQCPSSPGIINLEVLESLHYPKSLKSVEELRKENRFIQSLVDEDECFFSLDDYGDFGSNFWYKDCPSVYCSTEIDTSKRSFTLPRVLFVHCANFVCKDEDSKEFCCEDFGVLPSDILNVRREVEGWNGYPHAYSYLVLRVIVCLRMVNEDDLLRWVIENSPRYGVIIDAPMRDHVFLLLKLCLKAIAMEANCTCELMKEDGEGRNEDLKFGSVSCPVLVEAMSWLGSQLCVLYGEPNGRFFSINMLKQCILNATKGLLTFLLEKKTTESSASKEGFGKLDGSVGQISSEYPRNIVVGNVKIEEPTDDCEKKTSIISASTGSLVFVSQVAAAIAALHERFLLEEKIKGIRLAGSLSKSQRLAEHSYVTMKAEEERRNRSDYKPILEHDGLLWHRSRNQDSNEKKTREQILAEDRDYKRRRVSYRGKKVKRSITEVMRDIIEVHMEEINQAGGIGCFVKGSAEDGVYPTRPVSVDDLKVERTVKRDIHDSPEQSGEKSHGYRKQVEDQHRRDFHERYEHIEAKYKSSRKEKRDREYRSRSPEKHSSNRRSQDNRRGHDEKERTKSKYDSVSSHTTRHHGREDMEVVDPNLLHRVGLMTDMILQNQILGTRISMMTTLLAANMSKRKMASINHENRQHRIESGLTSVTACRN
ncbi:hypothetical protein ACHQM5_028331 [Ranunculus cassubicifolius]